MPVTEDMLETEANRILNMFPQWMCGQQRRSLRGMLRSSATEARLAAYRFLCRHLSDDCHLVQLGERLTVRGTLNPAFRHFQS